jgi:hypothetical protein
MGLDIKSNLKPIKMTPSPAEYKFLDSQRSTTKNHGLKHGWPVNDARLDKKYGHVHNSGDNTQVLLNSS